MFHLKLKPETAVRRRFGDQRPCGGLLRNHHLVGMTAQDRAVALLQESDGLQVFLAALGVRLPLTVTAVIVKVEHAGHRVDAQAVQVILLDPEQCAGDQEALYLAHAVVENHSAPFLVLATAGVGVFIAGGAVKHVQPVGILGEVGRHPVQNHADTGLVHLVHKVHEILGGAVTAGRGRSTR